MIIAGILILLAYLLGSIASAVLVCRIFNLSDPRSEGSGNPGATNVMRLHGKKAAILTLTGDVLKGFIPVFIALLLNQPPLIVALCGLAAFSGHLFPVFFKFKGGKGVATLIGVLFASQWQLGLAYVVSWLIMAFIFRYSSLAALTAAFLTPVFSWFLLHELNYLICHVIMMGLLIWRHQSNIQNLISGKEDKIGQKDI
ncbi:MAG: glycerol-3-phosphate 1-O-acyltransferase PlsY [Proteobacteria bacterium]|nr:glycerol-3-phosphate 1-O-acyltransferase PlsY [Pseudomonadota bacterium]